MRNILILLFIFVTVGCIAQNNNKAISFGVGQMKFTELKVGKLEKAPPLYSNLNDGDHYYKLKPNCSVSLGIELTRSVYKRMNFSSVIHIQLNKSSEHAEGQLVPTDIGRDCSNKDSCSFLDITKTEILLRVPALINTNFYKSQLRTYFGLVNYLVLGGHYYYEFRRLKEIEKRDQWSSSFSQFPNRFINLAGCVGAEYSFRKFGIALNYEIFYNKNYSVGAFRYSTVQNYSLLLKYYYR